MPDFDLADLYETSTKVFNQAVKRNVERFSPDFMFQLSEIEWQMRGSGFDAGNTFKYRSQIVTGWEFYKNTGQRMPCHTLLLSRAMPC